ncbi:unnamed protein product [Musa acuminata subsp. burmannicoides]
MEAESEIWISLLPQTPRCLDVPLQLIGIEPDSKVKDIQWDDKHSMELSNLHETAKETGNSPGSETYRGSVIPQMIK